MDKRIFSSVLLVGVTIGFAQDKGVATGPITTDRPDFTESPVVVPTKWLQIETGATHQWAKGSRSFSVPETLFRYGTGPRTELRFAIPDYNWLRAGGETMTGFGDAYLGAKFQLGPLSNGDDFALIPALNIPSRNRNFSSNTFDPELKVCWGRVLSPCVSITAMAYGLSTETDSERRFYFTQTVSLGFALSERLGAFLEYAGTFTKREVPGHIAHFGFAYRPTSNTQFDIHSGFSIGGS